MRGATWLRWSGHDGISTLHQGADLARGWTEKDVDGLDGWVALVEGRIVLGAGPGGGLPEPVVIAGCPFGSVRSPHAPRGRRTEPRTPWRIPW
ncbi:hypothetical protein J5Y04_31570 [Kitasatospora sp. RG8]|uniref:hypothetical protein n=1 Tax=Kitasatospora sp. RG8 TaxID=2820815 RepID=UPI001ADFAB60|nr:hypothetical protein [Kitasatospora sp. RG8]MBP0454047.1 hypothetical protein [Kitasatospora sp. RG8]